MEHKLETQLHNFRYNSIIIKSPVTVEWFKYDLDENLEENITGFTASDLKLFQDYVVSNETNFGGPKNYFTVSSVEIPIEDIYDLVPDERLQLPEYLIIRPKPLLDRSRNIFRCMDIRVCANDEDSHTYNLPFGVVGRIISMS